MREHEVPTHVQAEDRVLLWFTFPQIVALVAVCALSYGAYRYAPVGPSEVRLAIAVLLGLAGIAATVGRVGGRGLPLAAADLLRFWLGSRRYVGTPAQLVRSQPPASVQPVKSGPGALRMMVRRAGRTLRLMARRAVRGLRRLRRSRERRNGRMPLRRHPWLGKRRHVGEGGKRTAKQDGKHGKKTPGRVRGGAWVGLVAVTVLAVAASALPPAALADGREPWREELGFEVTEPVEGRRIFVEGLSVSGDRAGVTLRAATDLDLRVRAYGGPEGDSLRFWDSASLVEGERVDYSLPLDGDSPSLTFSWVDGLGQAGAVTLRDGQIPYPLPSVEGELCDLRVVSLDWTQGRVSGAVESDCVAAVEEEMSLQTVAGHESVTETALLHAGVTGIAGNVNVIIGGSRARVPFVPNGETAFSVPVAAGKAVHRIAIQASLTAALRVPLPPLTRLTHRPEWTERRIETVRLVRPGTRRTVSETVAVSHLDGTTTYHVVTAHLSIPSRTIYKNVTIAIVHPERVEAEVVARQPTTGSRSETLQMAALSIGSDAPFEVLALPQPEPEDEPAEQKPLTEKERDGLFGLFGWRWFR